MGPIRRKGWVLCNRPTLAPFAESCRTQIMPPAWLRNCTQELLRRYPNDRIDISLKNPRSLAGTTPEWRMKCLDCPGKVNSVFSTTVSFLMLMDLILLSCIPMVPERPSKTLRSTSKIGRTARGLSIASNTEYVWAPRHEVKWTRGPLSLFVVHHSSFASLLSFSFRLFRLLFHLPWLEIYFAALRKMYCRILFVFALSLCRGYARFAL
jgi:hypothetical protein